MAKPVPTITLNKVAPSVRRLLSSAAEGAKTPVLDNESVRRAFGILELDAKIAPPTTRQTSENPAVDALLGARDAQSQTQIQLQARSDVLGSRIASRIGIPDTQSRLEALTQGVLFGDKNPETITEIKRLNAVLTTQNNLLAQELKTTLSKDPEIIQLNKQAATDKVRVANAQTNLTQANAIAATTRAEQAAERGRRDASKVQEAARKAALSDSAINTIGRLLNIDDTQASKTLLSGAVPVSIKPLAQALEAGSDAVNIKSQSVRIDDVSRKAYRNFVSTSPQVTAENRDIVLKNYDEVSQLLDKIDIQAGEAVSTEIATTGNVLLNKDKALIAAKKESLFKLKAGQAALDRFSAQTLANPELLLPKIGAAEDIALANELISLMQDNTGGQNDSFQNRLTTAIKSFDQGLRRKDKRSVATRFLEGSPEIIAMEKQEIIVLKTMIHAALDRYNAVHKQFGFDLSPSISDSIFQAAIINTKLPAIIRGQSNDLPLQLPTPPFRF